MTPRIPPRLATWFLERSANGKHNESLVGDLHEQYVAGKTAGWYWYQVAIALLIFSGRAIRVHSGSFIAAIALPGLVFLAWRQANALFVTKMRSLHTVIQRDLVLDYNISWILTLSIGFLLKSVFYLSAGWLAVRVHRSHPRLVVFVLAVALFLFFPLRSEFVSFPVFFIANIVTSYGCLVIGGMLAKRSQYDATSAN